jgi:hypothetical protein
MGPQENTLPQEGVQALEGRPRELARQASDEFSQVWDAGRSKLVSYAYPAVRNLARPSPPGFLSSRHAKHQGLMQFAGACLTSTHVPMGVLQFLHDTTVSLAGA